MKNWFYQKQVELDLHCLLKASEYDQEMAQSQTPDQPMALGGQNTDSHMKERRNFVKQPVQDDCNTRKDAKSYIE